MVRGIGISPGIIFGKAKTMIKNQVNLEKKNIEDRNEEIDRLVHAIASSKQQINEIAIKTRATIGESEAKIFEAHELILEDATLIDGIKDKINEEMVNAEYAVSVVAKQFMDIFDSMDDAYMKEKSADIKDVSDRIIRNLLGIEAWHLADNEDKVIIVAEDLTPSDTALLDKNKVLGFVTAVGGKTSHTAILARILEIPAISGIQGIMEKLHDGDDLILDGQEGIVIVNPSPDDIHDYQEKKKVYDNQLLLYKKYLNKPSITKDGKEVEIFANIGLPDDTDKVIANGAEGIGLFRTEFLFMNRKNLPTEQEQYEAYKDVATRLKGKPVVIRTLDIGGDKEVDYLHLQAELNPFLGYRAIRLCLDRKEIFMTQLRALLRASAYGNIKIMFPMISSVHELREAKQMLQEAKKALENEGILYNDTIELGMMIEVPSAAMMSDLLAKEVDFFSIGTNDLIQYMVAVDRGNEKIAHLYHEFNPGVLRMIKMVIDNAHEANIWVGMCGEAAANPYMLPLLLAMGLDEFSVCPSAVLELRYIMSKLSVDDIKSKLDTILMMAEEHAIEKYMEEYYDKHIN
ncbi:phosphoenolpyruvate--protein phosphotransferase [Vallitalea pronyensis]|uniref:Phosphoenolpyruvate-protein phosphotransferase n=1 Tax=Vallitalea pronyensis TaxID=1348613 RepID=A0A8J8SIL4_9FIRM|nr:phosphoenolpyruvate--protein phosphotransferase [Vallitalea pronyensis]QUI24567.1 phosphoenolpyruvate--protein phosphotransferase [Vallitalea pronyensis]